MPTYYNEIDPYGCAVLRARIASGELPPGLVDERDIRLVTPDDLAPFDAWHFFAGIGGGALSARMAGVDAGRRIATNGFPCQDISFAGNGAGLLGNRSGLFFTSMKLLSAIRPELTLSENVAALRSRGLDTVVAEFATDGFDLEWETISAADVGAPHERERLWILAYPTRLLQVPAGAAPFARLVGDSWLTDQATMFGDFETYGKHGEKWPRSGMCVGGHAFDTTRSARARRMNGRTPARDDRWPTPTASAGGQNATSPSSHLAREGEGRHGLNLIGAAIMAEQKWPTPHGMSVAAGGKPYDGHGNELSMAVRVEEGESDSERSARRIGKPWPTPTADLARAGRGDRPSELARHTPGLETAAMLEERGPVSIADVRETREEAQMEHDARERKHAENLIVGTHTCDQGHISRHDMYTACPECGTYGGTVTYDEADGGAPEPRWSTPTAQDAKNSTLPPSQHDRDSIPGQLLREADGWPTPTTQDSVGSRRTTARTEEWKSNPGTTLTDAAIIATGEWDGKPMPDGTKLGRLNPAWVATLMGYAPSWGIVTAAPELYRIPVPTDAACFLGGPEWPAPPGVPQREWEPPRLVPDIQTEGRRALAAYGNAWVPRCAVEAWRQGRALLEGRR